MLFRNIGLLARYANPAVCTILARLITSLKNRGCNVWLDERGSQFPDIRGAQISTLRSIGESCDLAIVVGGDGTLLNAVRGLAGYNVPIMGINLGYLGFLVDTHPSVMEEVLDEVMAGIYKSENRYLLHATVMRGGGLIGESDAFNDVEVHRWGVARMVEFEVYLDGELVYALRADGIIASTTTGSTAHSLSAGGPVMHPSVSAVLLTPICPHTVNTRPLIVSLESSIEVVIISGSYEHAQMTCDGQISLGLARGDRVLIRKLESGIRLLHPRNYNYFQVLREKLYWGKSAANPTVNLG